MNSSLSILHALGCHLVPFSPAEEKEEEKEEENDKYFYYTYIWEKINFSPLTGASELNKWFNIRGKSFLSKKGVKPRFIILPDCDLPTILLKPIPIVRGEVLYSLPPSLFTRWVDNAYLLSMFIRILFWITQSNRSYLIICNRNFSFYL